MSRLTDKEIIQVLSNDDCKECALSIPMYNSTLPCLECKARIIEAKTAAAVYKEVGEIFKVYDKYIEILDEEGGTLVSLAYAHGWRSTRVEAGKQCRAEISLLKEKYNLLAGLPPEGREG